jgi:hypothetical protein
MNFFRKALSVSMNILPKEFQILLHMRIKYSFSSQVYLIYSTWRVIW